MLSALSCGKIFYEKDIIQGSLNREMVMRFISLSCALLLCGCLVGCGTEKSEGEAEAGCSGGEVKCAYTGKCEEQLELSREKGFANTPEAFERYCEN